MSIESLLYSIPGLLVAFVFHELAHGYVAYALGDPTPRYMGRLTLNPIRHIDPVGMIMLLLFRFGWAKPVQVNPMNFEDPRKGMALVAFAGPLVNFILAFLSLLVIHAVHLTPYSTVWIIFYYSALMNVGLGVFNLLPIPPLDGSKVLAGFLPPGMAYRLEAGENYGWLILILLLMTGVVGAILRPMAGLMLQALNGLAVALVPAGGGLFF